nr:unnamed protein product [Digitaria exilis]
MPGAEVRPCGVSVAGGERERVSPTWPEERPRKVRERARESPTLPEEQAPQVGNGSDGCGADSTRRLPSVGDLGLGGGRRSQRRGRKAEPAASTQALGP